MDYERYTSVIECCPRCDSTAKNILIVRRLNTNGHILNYQSCVETDHDSWHEPAKLNWQYVVLVAWQARASQEPRPSGELRPIAPIGAKILDHPDLQQWFEQGYASQEADGLWLHYTAICSLLRAASERGQECVGYPTCDGDLEGEPHDPSCPAAPPVEKGRES